MTPFIYAQKALRCVVGSNLLAIHRPKINDEKREMKAWLISEEAQELKIIRCKMNHKSMKRVIKKGTATAGCEIIYLQTTELPKGMKKREEKL